MGKHTSCCLLSLCLIIFLSCTKEPVKGDFVQGQIALTFDDASVENWNQYLPLLDSLNIKATFYISHYHTFNAQKKAKLKEIEAHGHEIAFHTATHPDLVKAVAKRGMAYVEEKEIKNDLQLMRADGYNVTNFAYPYGSHTAQLNTCLLRTFKSIRMVTNAQNYGKSLTKTSGDWQVLYGLSIDNNSLLTDAKLIGFMDDAQRLHDCLILFAHQINTSATVWQVSAEKLRLIATEAKRRQLKFITVNEFAK